jgi:transposase
VASPYGSPLIHLRDVLGTLYTDDDFAELFPSHGQPAAAHWRLTLVNVMQLVTH